MLNPSPRVGLLLSEVHKTATVSGAANVAANFELWGSPLLTPGTGVPLMIGMVETQPRERI